MQIAVSPSPGLCSLHPVPGWNRLSDWLPVTQSDHQQRTDAPVVCAAERDGWGWPEDAGEERDREDPADRGSGGESHAGAGEDGSHSSFLRWTCYSIRMRSFSLCGSSTVGLPGSLQQRGDGYSCNEQTRLLRQRPPQTWEARPHYLCATTGPAGKLWQNKQKFCHIYFIYHQKHAEMRSKRRSCKQSKQWKSCCVFLSTTVSTKHKYSDMKTQMLQKMLQYNNNNVQSDWIDDTTILIVVEHFLQKLHFACAGQRRHDAFYYWCVFNSQHFLSRLVFASWKYVQSRCP